MNEFGLAKMMVGVRAAELSEEIVRHAVNPNNPSWWSIKVKLAELRQAFDAADELEKAQGGDRRSGVSR